MLLNKEQLNTYKLCSSDKTRPILQTIECKQVENNSVVTVTDGYLAIRVTANNGDVNDFINDKNDKPLPDTDVSLLPATVAKKVIGNITNNKTIPILSNALVGCGVVSTSDVSTINKIEYKELDDKFPDAGSLIDNAKNDEDYYKAKLDPRLLIKLLEQYKDDDCIYLSINKDNHKPVYIVNQSDTIKDGLLMPLK